jgi:starch-binding outer membrane protein SusE/F
MKKSIKYFLTTLILITTLVACKKDENKVVFEGGDKPLLSVSSTAPLVLNIANGANQALVFSWTNPNYKFNTGSSSQDVYYTLQIDTAGSNFTNPKIGERSVSKDLSTSITVKELNTLMLAMGLLENLPHNMEMRIKSTLINSSVPLYSNVVKIVITPYLDVVYPVPVKLYITGSATPGNWMNAGDPENVNQRFTKVSSSKFELTITLSANNSFLLIPVYGDWRNKYGFTGSNNANSVTGDTFKPDGGDLKAPATTKSYKVTVDFKTGKYTVE